MREDSGDSFEKLLRNVLIPEAHRLPGCKLFSVYQELDNARNFIFYETWDSHDSVDVYKRNLIKILGNPHPGEEFPAQMNDMIESDEDLL